MNPWMMKLCECGRAPGACKFFNYSFAIAFCNMGEASYKDWHCLTVGSYCFQFILEPKSFIDALRHRIFQTPVSFIFLQMFSKWLLLVIPLLKMFLSSSEAISIYLYLSICYWRTANYNCRYYWLPFKCFFVKQKRRKAKQIIYTLRSITAPWRGA